MKILFLDYDGVINMFNRDTRYSTPTKDIEGVMTQAEPELVYRVNLIVERTGCEIVLSSSWRHWPDWRDALRLSGIVKPILDCTPTAMLLTSRGMEIQHWLIQHPEVERYAIVDDDSDMLKSQLPNFFKTDVRYGLTQEIADAIEQHLS
jgi:hypothetical protein